MQWVYLTGGPEYFSVILWLCVEACYNVPLCQSPVIFYNDGARAYLMLVYTHIHMYTTKCITLLSQGSDGAGELFILVT